MKAMPLTRLIGKVPGNQDVIVKQYLGDRSIIYRASANDLVEILHHTQELRESEVYGVNIEDGTLVIEVIYE